MLRALRILVVSIAFVVALVLPASAPALTVNAPDPGYYLYLVTSGTAASESEVNDVKLEYVYDANAFSYKYVITETSAPLVAGDNCTSVSPTVVECLENQIIHIIVDLLGGNDRLTVSSADGKALGYFLTGNIAIHGGGGRDVLQGGLPGEGLYGDGGGDVIKGGGEPGAGQTHQDFITGGKGRDRMLGQAGSDFIKAKDGIADREIDCGKSLDRSPRFDRGLDPKPVSC